MISVMKNHFSKSSTVFTLIFFWAANFAGTEIPKDLALAKEGVPTILHIQTAHGNYEAQLRIREILKILHDQYGFKTLFVEGASGELNPDYLRLFPTSELNIAFADALTRQGELTGVEYYLMDAPSDVKAFGIERPELYREGLAAFQKVQLAKDQTQRFLQILEGEWNRLASLMLSQEIRQELTDWKKFHEGSRDFFPYIKRLAGKAKRILAFNLEKLSAQTEWPQLTRALVLESMEPGLDQKIILKERRKFLGRLQNQNAFSGFSDLLRQQEIEFSRSAAENFLREAEKSKDNALPEELNRWIGFKILQGELDSEALFDEVDRLSAMVLKKLVSTRKERELLELDRDLTLLKKIFSLELSRQDWKLAFVRQDLLAPEALQARFHKIGAKLNGPVSDLAEIYRAAFRFYELIEERENGFEEIISREMKNQKLGKAVVITGGFHAEGLRQKLREKGIRYETLIPRFTKQGGASPYRDAMLEKTPTLFDLATMEEAAKMLNWKTLFSMGRSGRSELRVVTAGFIEAAKQAENIQELRQFWKNFSTSIYAKDRGIQVREILLPSPEKFASRFNLLNEDFAVTYASAEEGFNYEVKKLGQNSVPLPKVPGSEKQPVRPGTFGRGTRSRSETRAEVFFRHVPVKTDPEGDHLNEPGEFVNLDALGLEKQLPYITPFEARIIQAFLYADYTRQPRAFEQGPGTFFFPEFEGHLTDLEIKTFLQTLYEVQETAKREKGRFDKGMMIRMMGDVYSEINRLDKREPVLNRTEAVLNMERSAWPRIFSDLIERILKNRNAKSEFNAAGLVQIGNKNYIQILPGAVTGLEFLPGKFPEKGISLVLGNQKAVITAIYRKNQFQNAGSWLIRYEQDQKQNVTFPRRGGYVSLGSNPILPREWGKKIFIPSSGEIAPSHAILDVSERKGILKIQVTDGYADEKALQWKPSGKITFLEYPDLKDVRLPLLRSEVRQPQEQSATAHPKILPAAIQNVSWGRPDFSRFNALPIEMKILALTGGITKISTPKDLRILENYARLIRPAASSDALQEIGKTYPVARSSEAPGALVLVTAKLPKPSELAALRSLLLSQKNEFFRLAVPQKAVSELEMKKFSVSVQRIFSPAKEVRDRFDFVFIKDGEDLGEIPREIYRLMKEKGIPVQNVQDLQSKYFVQWFDEGVAPYLDISSSLDPYAKIMRSNLENENLYSQLRVWGAASAMKISQGIPAVDVDRGTSAFQEQGRFIQFRVTDALRGLVEGFMQALQVTLRLAQSA